MEYPDADRAEARCKIGYFKAIGIEQSGRAKASGRRPDGNCWGGGKQWIVEDQVDILRGETGWCL